MNSYLYRIISAGSKNACMKIDDFFFFAVFISVIIVFAVHLCDMTMLNLMKTPVCGMFICMYVTPEAKNNSGVSQSILSSHLIIWYGNLNNKLQIIVNMASKIIGNSTKTFEHDL